MFIYYYSGRKADRVKVSVALSNSFFWGGGGGGGGVAMGREIRLRDTRPVCSRSRFLYSAGTSYVFCRVQLILGRVLCFRAVSECLQYASQT